MNKEEQIKRLAQNLFNKGFSNSMDFAVSTAAKMLGFSDDMLTNNLMREEEAKFGGESILNGGYNYDEKHLKKYAKPNPINNGDRMDCVNNSENIQSNPGNLRKRISQSIAEERVYSMIPGAVKEAIREPAKPTPIYEDKSSSSINVMNEYQTPRTDNVRLNNENSKIENKVNNASFDFSQEIQKPALNIEYSPVEKEVSVEFRKEEKAEENIEQNMFSSSDSSLELSQPQKNIEDNINLEMNSAPNISELDSAKQNEDIFIHSLQNDDQNQNNNLTEELNIEEQTSLISGFVHEKQSESPQEIQGLKQNNESVNSSIVGDSSEDFFTSSLDTKANHNKEYQDNFSDKNSSSFLNEISNNSSNNIDGSYDQENVSQSQANNVSADQKPPAEASINLTSMFDYRNLTNK